MNSRFKNKVVIVTGGNSGIGRGIVHRFCREGADVAIAGRNSERGITVEAETSEMQGTAKFFRADLSSEAQVKEMVARAAKHFGHIDIVINNAGIGCQRCGIEPNDPPGLRWDSLRGNNIDAAYFVSSYALPHLAKQEDSAIVNISSTATLHGNWGLYGVAKAAVEALTRSFACEAAPSGIRVNCISPGWIASGEDKDTAAAGTADGSWALPPSLFNRMGTTDEIASAAAFLASSEASFITGQTLIVDGGMVITDYPSIPMLNQVGHRVYSHSAKPR